MIHSSGEEKRSVWTLSAGQFSGIVSYREPALAYVGIVSVRLTYAS